MRRLYFIISVALLTASAATLQAQVEVTELTQQWHSNHWENAVEYTGFIYNSNCQELYHLVETWDSSANNWNDNSQSNSSYYNSGKLYQDSIQHWNIPNPGWNNSELITFTYDVNNYLINSTAKSWNTTTNAWQNNSQINYINNSDGTPHIFYDLVWSGSVWDTTAIETNIYNTPGQLDTELIDYPAYPDGNQRNYYIYMSGYINVVTQAWSTTSNSWQNEALSNYFPSLNTPDSIISETWNSATNSWNTTGRATFTYTPCTPTAVKQINPADPVAIYPNPTTGHFTITGLTQGQTIEIYNYTGQRIESRIADNTTMDFNIAAYASGMYMVRVQNTDGSVIAQKKMVKTQ